MIKALPVTQNINRLPAGRLCHLDPLMQGAAFHVPNSLGDYTIQPAGRTLQLNQIPFGHLEQLVDHHQQSLRCGKNLLEIMGRFFIHLHNPFQKLGVAGDRS